jgi:hypothetical protein
MNDKDFEALTNKAAVIAGLHGSLHPAWDVICDARAILNGKPIYLSKPTELVREICTGYMNNLVKSHQIATLRSALRVAKDNLERGEYSDAARDIIESALERTEK